MENKAFITTLADTEVAFRFHLHGTGMLFHSCEKKRIPEGYRGAFLSVGPEKFYSYAQENRCTPETAEFSCLMMEAADFLAERNRTMFHGAAFACEGAAYILTAPSGTGKSTQLQNLRRLYGDRIRVINGDKPILTLGPEGRITVWPSPWNGKEGWAGRDHAPLKGMVFLEQGEENRLRPMEGQEAAAALIEQFIYSAKTAVSVHTVCAAADAAARTVPLYYFVNRGDTASSRVLFEGIRKGGSV